MPDPYDVLTIAAVVDELTATIENGRIQRIGLVDARTIGAEIYASGRRHYLLASADDQLPRLRLASDMPSLDPALVTPFGLLLRKYTRGGIILGIDQPPLERVVRMSIAKRLSPLKNRDDAANPATRLDTGDEEDEPDDEDATENDNSQISYVSLYVELMGRRSNLILVDDQGVILESAKRVTPAMSRVRTVLPRAPYLPPPPPDRRDPRAASESEMGKLLSGLAANAELSRAIVSAFRGISPPMARELVFRATGRGTLPVAEIGPDAAPALTEAMQALLEPLKSPQWNPRLYLERGNDGEHEDTGAVAAFSAIPFRHLAADYDEVAMASISEAAARAESAIQRPSPQRHAQRRQRLLDAVGAAREKATRRLAALAGQSARAADAERLRRSGELIYAHLWQIEPGQSELIAEGETIRLDPALSANENAQAYFEKYRKAQSADAQIPELAAESEAEIAYLDQLTTFIQQAPGFAELEALAAEWAEQASPESAKPRRKQAPRRPKALVDDAGNSIYVGRSGPQNDLLTFELAAPDDTWLHARGVGGAHVIIRWRNPGSPENPETVAAAASLAAWYSAARESGGVEVDVAQRRHVRKIKGGRPGMVTYRNERTVRVQPAPEERLRDVLTER